MSTQDKSSDNMVQSDFLRNIEEDDDITTAVAASLETPQGVPHERVQRPDMGWSPKTSEDWMTYNRQKAAIDEAEQNKDSPGYLKAMLESLVEDAGSGKPPGNPMSSLPNVPTSAPRKANSAVGFYGTSRDSPPRIDEMIMTMSAKQALEVPWLNVPNGDTWVFIDPPPKQPEQDDESYFRYVERSRVPKVMSSATLFALNSSYFQKAMGPTAQHRVLRRRALVGKLPPHIRYVLDLTPPSEGDEAAYLLSELSCSPGVTKWIIAGKLWRISKTLIGGVDDSTQYNRVATEAYVRNMKTGIESSSTSDWEKDHAKLQLEESVLPIPLAYTALRHRSAIERVLLAISGIDPELDSAPKVWTACAVAQYFDVRTPFDDYVVRWLRADPNNHFLEVLPEVTLKIADGLQCHDLCRDAFAILVGEEALNSCYRNRSEACHPEVIRGIVSVHRRKKDSLPEAYQTRIEYASKALIDRVSQTFFKLVSLDWMENLPESKKLSTEPPSETQSCAATLNMKLKAYIRGAIFRALCRQCLVSESSNPSLDYYETNNLFPLVNHKRVWNDLLPQERLLTRSFWQSFSSSGLFAGPTNMDIDLLQLEEISPAETALRQNGVFEVVDMAELETQAMLYRRSPNPRNPFNQSHSTFNLRLLFEQATEYLNDVESRILRYTDADLRAEAHTLSLSDFIVSLEDSEFKYLPLWAGGCDDGSGGVYDDNVPFATEGFSHPGPNVHLGSGSSVASSEFDFIRGVSSHNTSTLTQGLSEGSVCSATIRSASEYDDPFADGKEPSTPADSEYDFGSISSVGVGSTAERLARFGLGPDTGMSEKAKGKLPARNNPVETTLPYRGLDEQTDTDGNPSAGVVKEEPNSDDDFASIFDDDDEDQDLDLNDRENDFDEGDDSDDTVGGEKDSEDEDMVMV